MCLSRVVNFDPIAAYVSAGATGHPYNVLGDLGTIACLGCCFQIKIQLRRLIRLGLRVPDRRLDRATHKQCHPVNARL